MALAGKTRALIAATFDANLPGGGNEYSFDLARIWIERGFTVHVLASTYQRKLGDLQRYADSGELIVHAISDVGRIQMAHLFDETVYALVSQPPRRIML